MFNVHEVIFFILSSQNKAGVEVLRLADKSLLS